MVYYGVPKKPEFYYSEPEKRTTIIFKVYVDMWKSTLVPEGCIKVEISDINSRTTFDDTTDSVELIFHGVERDNPNYDSELALYNKRLAEYDEKVKNWELEVKKIQEQNDSNEKAIYERLKIKYGAN